MDLINHTPYSAGLFRMLIEENCFASAIIVRVTYDYDRENEIASPSLQQTWPVKMEPWECEFGPMQNDAVFYRGGTDLFVFATAHAPQGKPAAKINVTVSIKNKLSHTIAVFGNRIWEKSFMGIAKSEPEPFTEMPLSLFNSFGGYSSWDGLKIPFGNNVYGKGFYWEKESAIGKPLPNIENPQSLINNWNERPDPVGICMCPMSELHMRGNIDLDENGLVNVIRPRFFNAAFPEMIIDNLNSGEKITISGVTLSGTYSFKIPIHKLQIKLSLGDMLIEEFLKIDQVGIVVDKNQAFITYRFPFKYIFREKQKRKCEIVEII